MEWQLFNIDAQEIVLETQSDVDESATVEHVLKVAVNNTTF